MTKIIICGAGGRMGKRIAFYAYQDKDVEIIGAVDAPGAPTLGQDIGKISGVGSLGVAIVDDLTKIINKGDVVIDFTAPEVSVANAKICKQAGKAIVIGTTGIKQEQLVLIKECAKTIPCLVSPNMSVGVNLLFNIAAKVAQVLHEDCDIEIVEAHHRLKKDAPSGTAAKLAEVIAGAIDRDLEENAVYGRYGILGERKREEIGIHAVRGGDIVGEHTVFFTTMGERIELTHRAHTRDIFATGAVKSAKFLSGKTPGYYNMNDVLGL